MFVQVTEKTELCLIGKVLDNKIANREGLEGAIRAVWKISSYFRVEQTGVSNVFYF